MVNVDEFVGVLANRMGVKRPYVTKLLSGDVNITFGAAQRIAAALGMEFQYGLVRQ